MLTGSPLAYMNMQIRTQICTEQLFATQNSMFMFLKGDLSNVLVIFKLRLENFLI